METALGIAAQIRTGELTVQDAVENCISRIEEVNPRLNAVVETCYDRARSEARDKDALLKMMSRQERQSLPPLFGVPFTSKEMMANKGMKCTLGSIHRKDRVFDTDATVVQRIKKAGAVLLGTTNVPEIGFWFECDNLVYGSTKNPFDVTRTPGGSSGGEGSIIGAGASPFGIGSDVGGSIRLPAAFCGIFGHKPSDRVIPITGHEPLFEHNAHELTGARYPFTVIGPMARSASDLEALFRLLIGPDGIDRNTKPDFQFRPLLSAADKIRVYSLPSPRIHGTTETEKDLVQAVQNAVRYLHEMGSTTLELDSKLFLRAFDLWSARIRSLEGRNFTQFLTNQGRVHYPLELAKLLIKKNIYTLPAILTGLVDVAGHQDPELLKKELAELAALKTRLTQWLKDDGVLLMPVHPRKAPPLNSTYTRPFDFSYTGVINALGFPATAVPMGLSKEGLPLSVQVIAAEDQDHLCLSVAKMLEAGFGGWQRPLVRN